MIRGEIWWLDFGIPYGSEPGYRRPAVVVQENTFNKSDINKYHRCHSAYDKSFYGRISVQ